MSRVMPGISLLRDDEEVMPGNDFFEPVADVSHEIDVLLEAQLVLVFEVILVLEDDRHSVLLDRLSGALHGLQIAALNVDLYEAHALLNVQRVDGEGLHLSPRAGVVVDAVGPVCGPALEIL